MSRYSEWKNIIENFLTQCIAEKKPVFGIPQWYDNVGTINIICIRKNEELSFNNIQVNNDKLLVFENRPNDCYRLYEFPCTADPRGKRYKIAHLCEGCYDSYVVRPHNWQPGRTALGQDANRVRVARTDLNGNLLYYDVGYFGINIHDAKGNTSLGCIMIDWHYRWQYFSEFKPLLLRARKVHKKKKLNFTLFLINHKTLGRIQDEIKT